MTSPATTPPTRPHKTDTAQRVVKRLKHYARKDRYAQAFEDAGLDRIAQALRECHTTDTLVGCSHCGKSWWVMTRCRLRVCPLCSWEVALDRADLLRKLCKPHAHPKLITLTMPTWTADPAEGVDLIRHYWNKLREHSVFASVTGGAYQIELLPKPDGWHIHIHALIVSDYVPYQRLFSAWREITNVDVPQVDVRAAETPDAQAYACKYASKSPAFDQSPDAIVQWYLATLHLRLFATFGTWYNITQERLLQAEGVEPFLPTCPFCGSTHTVFRVRDGPYIFGHEAWLSLASTYTVGGLTQRPSPLYELALRIR